jgi:hypothetical protein
VLIFTRYRRYSSFMSRSDNSHQVKATSANSKLDANPLGPFGMIPIRDEYGTERE